jgi:isopenicillin N synthase-like dioxygenase
MDTYSNSEGLPAIDASILNEEPSAERKKLLQLIITSLSIYGAIRITGHGLAARSIQRAFELVK